MELDPTRPVANILDRQEDLAQLEALLRAGRNVLVYGPRRMGKTSLLLATLRRLESDHLIVFVDCTRIDTDEALADRLLRELAATGAARWHRFWTWLKDTAHDLRVRIVLGGEPRLEVEPGRRSRSLADACELIGQVADAAEMPTVVVLDEFQVVLSRDDGATVAALRSVAQQQPRVRYVFSGSVETVLRTMTQSPKAPFWKQLVEFPVAGIDIEDLREHWPELFPLGASQEALDLIRQATGKATLRLIEVLDRLQRMPRGPLDLDAARLAIDAVAGLHAPDYERDLQLVKPGNQQRCLLGLARDRPRYATGKDFIAAHGLGTPASARAALKRLRDLEILGVNNEFLDPLFAYWLAGE